MDVAANEGWASGWWARQSHSRDGLVCHSAGDTDSLVAHKAGAKAEVG
ncbi:hypothetical protein ES705_38546 [subsurface metagenome]